MAEFLMPSLGADMSAGTLVKWRVAIGDRITKGDIVAEVETDKGTIEVEVFESGIVEAMLVQEGEKVPVGTPLARICAASAAEESLTEIETERLTVPAPANASEPVTAPVTAPGAVMTVGEPPNLDGPLASPAVRRRAHELDVSLEALAGTGEHGRITRDDVERSARVYAVPAQPLARVRISPYARRLAGAQGVDLDQIRGTGPGGAIRAGDITGAIAEPAHATSEDRMQRAIAASMSRANDEIPHYYVEHTVDMSPALEWLRAQNRVLPVAGRLVPGVLFLRAVARALGKHPRLNGTFEGGEVVPCDGLHIGLAVSLRGGGLVAPTLRDVDQGSVAELMARMTGLVSRARGGALRSSEMMTPGITLTALGERGVESVIPVIFPPQVAVVGFGAIVTRPWVVEDQVVPRPVVRATLGADHRVTNGHQGARFLSTLAHVMQEPEEL